MKRNTFSKKAIVLGIIILFVGSSGVSSITDYDKDVENTDYIIDKDETLNMKNNDYNNLVKQVIESGIISNDGWTEQDKLLASDGAYWDLFGYSVSIYGEYAIVGAYWDDDNGDDSGSAYIFKRDGAIWNEQAKLIASDGADYDEFGYSVSISGDYSIIGALGDDDNGNYSGSAYIFKRDGAIWNEQAKLIASDGADYNFFGISVSIDGDYTIVGAYGDDDNGASSGSAYIFKRDGTIWHEQAKLIASDGADYDEFGYSVSISGDYIITGAYGDDDNGNYSGSAYVFTNALPESVYVDDDFNETTEGWQITHFDNIQDGINAVTENGTVYVYNGIYYENVVVDKSINLVGENRETTIIDGSRIGDVVNIISDSVDISGFTIRHSEQGTGYDAGINLASNYSTITNNILSNNDWGADVRNSNHNIISDNIIRFNSGGAIHLVFSTDNTISKCNISNNGIRGIMLSGSDKNTISSNTFIRGGLETYYDSSHNTVFGNTINGKPLVYIEDESDITITDAGQVIIIMCENITVQGLVLSNTSIGIQVRNSQECNIIGNTIFDNSHGTAVVESSQILIEGNTFRKNLWYGIGIYHDQGETEVLKNTVVNNRNGLYIFNCRNGVGIFNNNISSNNLGIDISSVSSDCVVSGNEISNNNEGIKLKSSNNNIIYHNNFINNVQNAYDEYDNTWDNGYPSCGNYWDDYIGEDNDGDGVGDIPYNISGGDNQDRYPLIEPYGMTKLTISMGSGLFVSGIIKNIGNKTAFNVQWKITIDGGIVLIGRESSGYLPRPLLAGEEMSVSSGLVFGFGRIVITVSVWADNAPLVSKSIPGILILFFIKIT